MATNHINVIDEAVKSRFEPIEIPLPSEENRINIFKDILNISSLSENNKYSTIARLARITEGFSGRDIKGVCGDIDQKIRNNTSLDIAIAESFTSLKDNLFARLVQCEVVSYCPDNLLQIENIVCDDSTKDELRKFIETYSKNAILAKNKLRICNGISITGRGGNGQKFISKILANKLTYDLIVVPVKKIVSMSDILAQSVKLSLINGIVILFDGVDYMIRSGQYNEFIKWINLIRNENRAIIFIVTFSDLQCFDWNDFTNHFDVFVQLNNPNQEEKIKLVQSFFKHPSFNFQIDFSLEIAVEYINQEYSQPTISQIKTFCDMVKRKAFLDQPNNTTIHITEKYF